MHTRLSLLCCLTGMLLPGVATAAGVTWHGEDVDAAFAAAASQGKPMIVDVYATWCGPCHKLDAEVFPNAEVGREAAHFVAIKVDAETPRGERLVARYNVVGYPTVLVLTSAGEEIDRIFGFKPAAEFRDTLAAFRAGKNTLADLRKQFAERPKDQALMFQVGEREAIRGNAAEAEKLLGAVTRSDAKNAAGLASKSQLVLGKYLYLRGKKDYKKALKVLRGVKKSYPKSEEAKVVDYAIARALNGSGDHKAALAAMHAFVNQAPNKPGGYNAFAWFTFRENVGRDEGIKMARRGLKLDPKNSGLWDTLAELYAVTGKKQEAVAAIKKAIELAPEDDYYKRQLKKFAGGDAS